MTPGVIIRVIVDDEGKRRIVPQHKNFWAQFKATADLGEPYLLEVKSARKRSNPQNSYYWAVIIPFFQRKMLELGDAMSSEEAHELIKARFIPRVQDDNQRRVRLPDGEEVIVPPSTRRLNREQFGTLIDLLQVAFAQWFDGETFPLPEEKKI